MTTPEARWVVKYKEQRISEGIFLSSAVTAQDAVIEFLQSKEKSGDYLTFGLKVLVSRVGGWT